MRTKEKVSGGQGGLPLLVFNKPHIAKAGVRGSRRPEDA